MSRLRYLLAVAVLAMAASRNWQTGTLLDSDLSRIYLGTVSHGGGTIHATTDPFGNVSGSYSGNSHSVARYGTSEVEVIELGEYVYRESSGPSAVKR
jgi:hypothetical protein